MNSSEKLLNTPGLCSGNSKLQRPADKALSAVYHDCIMHGQNILRALVFAVFLSVGAAAIGTTVLLDDILQKYRQRKQMVTEKKHLRKLKALNEDYDALIRWLKNDPNRIRRVVAPTFRTNPNSQSTAYPRAGPEQLNAARKALTEKVKKHSLDPDVYRDRGTAVPDWLERIRKPRRRLALFLSGAALVLVSFIFFSRERE